MEEPRPNWKCLPSEIIHHILQLAAEDELPYEKYKYTLVCKAWTYWAQSVLYSNIKISKLSQFRKFTETVKQNTSFGRLVIVFNMSSLFLRMAGVLKKKIKTEILDTLTTLFSNYLPNIENIKSTGLITYTSVLKALKNSQLKRLKKLEPPQRDSKRSEVANYVKCVLLLKDRIESIWIPHVKLKNAETEESPFHQLYNDLDQFDKLEELSFEKNTTEKIQTLDYVAESCKSLKKIEFIFTPPENEAITTPRNNSISTDAMSNFAAKLNIKVLTCGVYSNNALFYIMHKFPQLQRLDLEMLGKNCDKPNQDILDQLLYFISKIETHSIKLVVDPATSTETMGSYWNTRSKPGNEYVKIQYHWYYEGQTELEFSKEDHPEGTFTGLTYPI